MILTGVELVCFTLTKQGNSGKTMKAKRDVFRDKSKGTLYMSTNDTPSQSIAALSRYPYKINHIIFDIPRDAPYLQVRAIFLLAEQCKSGMFSSSFRGEYRMKMQDQDLVVQINTNRDFNQDEISKFIPLNRWDIYRIWDDDNITKCNTITGFEEKPG